MNEKKISRQLDEFPDDEAPERSGCYMYAFYKLGLDPEEARMGVYSRQLREFFIKVDSKDTADALVLRSKHHGHIDHMVFIDQSHNGAMKQKGNFGWPIEETSVDTLLKGYPAEKYEYVYLKKKTTSRARNILKRILASREKT